MFDNRRRSGCKPCGLPEESKPSSSDSIINTSKGSCSLQKVKSIVKIGDRAVIMFDDCSYIEATLDTIDSSLIEGTAESLNNDLVNLINELKGLKDSINTLIQEKLNKEDLILITGLNSNNKKALALPIGD